MNLKKQTGFKAKLIEATLRLGRKKLLNQKMTFYEKLLDFIVDKLVRKKIKKQFGGNLKAFVSGGGALDKEIGEFLNAIGLPTLQGYGLTETSPVVSCNPIHKIKVETVGPPFKGNEVKIAEDGEILVKGENVMLGYWNKKEETDKVIEKINKKLTLLEKIKKIQLIDETFSIENGLMTPTMKVKRKKVTEKYKNQLENLY